MAVRFQVEVDWEGSAWQDESAYVRRVRTQTGFARAGEPVAAAGRCTLTLDNTTRRFSPGWDAGPLAGMLRPHRPVRVTAVHDGQAFPLFTGFIEQIAPRAGPEGQTVEVRCADALALLARTRVGAAYAASQSVAEVVRALIAGVLPPEVVQVDDNGDLLAHVGRAWPPERTMTLRALRDVCETVYARFFVSRGGQAVFYSRDRGQNPLAPTRLDVDAGTPIDGLDLRLDVGVVLNEAQVTVYPVETVGAPQTVWEARSVLRLAPGEVRDIFGLFRDAAGARTGAVNVQPPQPEADYTVWTHADATGYDLTHDPRFSLIAEVEATRVHLTLSNASPHVLYVTRLRVRGQPLVTYDPITVVAHNPASQATYQRRTRAFDLPMQPDPIFGLALAQYLVGRFGAATLHAARLTVRDRARIGAASVFAAGIMDRVTIRAAHVGLAATHLIRAVAYDLTATGFTVALDLEPADEGTTCVLDSAGYAHLDASAVLGL